MILVTHFTRKIVVKNHLKKRRYGREDMEMIYSFQSSKSPGKPNNIDPNVRPVRIKGRNV
jgi:hypothetical protein